MAMHLFLLHGKQAGGKDWYFGANQQWVCAREPRHRPSRCLPNWEGNSWRGPCRSLAAARVCELGLRFGGMADSLSMDLVFNCFCHEAPACCCFFLTAATALALSAGRSRALTVNPTYALWASKQQVAVAAGNTTEAQTTVDSEAS